MSRGRQVARGLGTLALALLGAAVAWLVVLRVRAEHSPEPLYTVASLPALPAADTNGWGLARGARPPELPAALNGLIVPGSTTAADWALVERSVPALREFVASPLVQASLRGFGAALDRPAFADACSADLFDRCPIVPIYQQHKLEEVAILARALEAPDDAVTRLVRLLRADAGWLGSSRSILSFEVAVASARRSLTVATLLLPRVSAGSRASLAGAVADVRRAPLDLRRPLIVEYLRGLSAIDIVASDASALRSMDPTSHPTSWTGRLVSAIGLDRGRTKRLLAERTRTWLGWLEQPATVAPPTEVTHAEQTLYWLDNPVGKRILDDLRMPPSLWPKVRLELGALGSESEALVAALR